MSWNNSQNHHKENQHHNKPHVTRQKSARKDLQADLNYWYDMIQAKGGNTYFEIHINNTKIVAKTTDLNEFSKIKKLIHSPQTQVIFIKIYRESNSGNKAHHLYDGAEIEVIEDFNSSEDASKSSLGAVVTQPSSSQKHYESLKGDIQGFLAGLGYDGMGSQNVNQMIDKRIEISQKEWELGELQKKYLELEKKFDKLSANYEKALKERDEYYEELEEVGKENKELRKKDPSTLNGFFNLFFQNAQNHLGGLMAQNAGGLSGIPGGESEGTKENHSYDPEEVEQALRIWRDLQSFGEHLHDLKQIIQILYVHQDLIADSLEFVRAGKPWRLYALVDEEEA